MRKWEFALEISKDKGLTEAEVVNKSGLLEEADVKDVPGVLHSISVLRNADERFLSEVKGALCN